ncbi:MAG: hypothetical protein EP329_09080 [Deltaproteobacteria bacterium]|nr:MAG: hypothetical protein EP329_09080 [Deltaproteobacteria bacterium]
MRSPLAAAGALLLAALSTVACVDEDCEVIGPERCSEGCMAVRSAPRWRVGVRSDCIRSGVFFGCTPDPDASRWGGGSTGLESACAYLPPPDPFMYCFNGRYDTDWFFAYGERFCGSGADCSGARDPLPAACVEDLPDDNISPQSAPLQPFDFDCSAQHPMPPACYTE